MKDIERDIKSVENIIRLLNSCLMISLRNSDLKSTKRVFADLQICKKELMKLTAEKERQLEKELEKIIKTVEADQEQKKEQKKDVAPN